MLDILFITYNLESLENPWKVHSTFLRHGNGIACIPAIGYFHFYGTEPDGKSLRIITIKTCTLRKENRFNDLTTWVVLSIKIVQLDVLRLGMIARLQRELYDI